MAIENTTPTTTCEVSGAFPEGRKPRWLRQRVDLTHAAAYEALGVNLPPRSRVLWAYIVNQASVSVTGNDGTSTANSLALVFHPTTATAPLTQPQTATVSSPAGGTSGYMLLLSTSTSSNGAVRGAPRFETSAPAVNTNTVGALITLQPAFTNSNRLYANGTSGFIFGTSTATSASTAGQVDVVIYYETFEDTPSYHG
jgi:hypothetical protein